MRTNKITPSVRPCQAQHGLMHYKFGSTLIPSSKESTLLTFSCKDVVCNWSTSRGDVPRRNSSGDQWPREHLLQLGFQTRGMAVCPFSFVFGWSTLIFGSAGAGQVGFNRDRGETLTSLRLSQVLFPSPPQFLLAKCAHDSSF